MALNPSSVAVTRKKYVRFHGASGAAQTAAMGAIQPSTARVFYVSSPPFADIQNDPIPPHDISFANDAAISGPV